MTKTLLLKIGADEVLAEHIKSGKGTTDSLKDLAGRAIDRFFNDYEQMPEEVEFVNTTGFGSPPHHGAEAV